MRLAYLVLAHNNQLHLKRLLQALSVGGQDCFLYIGADSLLDPYDFAGRNIFPLYKRDNVYWAGYSLVRATNELIRTAQSQGDYDRLVLLSGADYPVRSQAYIQSFFSTNLDANFINVVRMPHNRKSLNRMRNYHIETVASSNRSIAMISAGLRYAIQKFGIERNLPKPYDQYELYGGSQWWSFSGDFANYLLDFINANQEFVNFYRYTWAPDEMFFHTIIMNSPFRKSVRPSCTFRERDYFSGPPLVIQKRHIPMLAKRVVDGEYGRFEPLLARKFNDDSRDVVQLINDQLIECIR